MGKGALTAIRMARQKKGTTMPGRLTGGYYSGKPHPPTKGEKMVCIQLLLIGAATLLTLAYWVLK